MTGPRGRYALLLGLVVVCCVSLLASAATAAGPVTICAAGEIGTSARPCAMGGANDAVTVLRFLPGKGRYQIQVKNTSGLGYIETFDWAPPNDLAITAVTGTAGGRCSLAGGSISCVGARSGIAPPTCTCRSGGSLTVDFTATGLGRTYNGRYWTWQGVTSGDLQITAMAPVPIHIASSTTRFDMRVADARCVSCGQSSR